MNGEEGVIGGGGGVAMEELDVIVRERGEEKGRRKEKKKEKKLHKGGCRAMARPPPRCQGWWLSHPLVPTATPWCRCSHPQFFCLFSLFSFSFSFFEFFLKKIKNLIMIDDVTTYARCQIFIRPHGLPLIQLTIN